MEQIPCPSILIGRRPAGRRGIGNKPSNRVVDISINISFRIFRPLYIPVLIITICPGIPFLIRIGNQVILFVIRIRTGIASLIPRRKEVIPFIILIDAFAAVSVDHPYRTVSFVKENLFFRSIRIDRPIHAPIFIIRHFRNVAKPVGLFCQPPVFVISTPYAAAALFYAGHASVFVIAVLRLISQFIRKYRRPSLFVISSIALSSARRILFDNSAKSIVPAA